MQCYTAPTRRHHFRSFPGARSGADTKVSHDPMRPAICSSVCFYTVTYVVAAPDASKVVSARIDGRASLASELERVGHLESRVEGNTFA